MGKRPLVGDNRYFTTILLKGTAPYYQTPTMYYSGPVRSLIRKLRPSDPHEADGICHFYGGLFC